MLSQFVSYKNIFCHEEINFYLLFVHRVWHNSTGVYYQCDVGNSKLDKRFIICRNSYIGLFVFGFLIYLFHFGGG